MGKIGINKNFSNEIPLNFIISIFKVHFNLHVTSLPLFVANSVNQLLDHNSIINTSPSWNKCRLKEANQLIKMRSKPGYDDLGDDLVHSIAKANGALISHAFWSRNFWDYNNIGSIEVLRNFSLIKNLLNFIPY